MAPQNLGSKFALCWLCMPVSWKKQGTTAPKRDTEPRPITFGMAVAGNTALMGWSAEVDLLRVASIQTSVEIFSKALYCIDLCFGPSLWKYHHSRSPYKHSEDGKSSSKGFLLKTLFVHRHFVLRIPFIISLLLAPSSKVGPTCFIQNSRFWSLDLWV